MKAKLTVAGFALILISIAVLTFHIHKKNDENFIQQCEKLAMDWIHGQGLDRSDDLDSEISSTLQSAHFYDLRNDGGRELVMGISQQSVSKPGNEGRFPNHYSSLLYFLFQRTQPVLFEKIFTAGIDDSANVPEEKVLMIGGKLPRLLILFDGNSVQEGGEEGGGVAAHVYMMSGGKTKEVLVYSAYSFVRNAPRGYTSQISVGKGRGIVVDYSIPVRAANDPFTDLSVVHKKAFFDWDEGLGRYVPRKGNPELDAFITKDEPHR